MTGIDLPNGPNRHSVTSRCRDRTHQDKSLAEPVKGDVLDFCLPISRVYQQCFS